MLYPYAEFPGHLIITYSDVKDDGSVHVNFEQPASFGFKEARYSLPSFAELFNDGFNPKETEKNLTILKNNQSLILEMAHESEDETAD